MFLPCSFIKADELNAIPDLPQFRLLCVILWSRQQGAGLNGLYGESILIYLPPATKLGQGNIFRSVCQEFCRGGGVVSQHALQVTGPTSST